MRRVVGDGSEHPLAAARDEPLPGPAITNKGAASGLPDEDLVRGTTMPEHFRLLLKRSSLLKFAVGMACLAMLLAAIGPLISPVSLTASTSAVNQPPSLSHPFGTDPSGLDVFWRTLAAPRVDLVIAIVATLLSLSVGFLVGLLTGFFGGRRGEFIMRVSDTLQSFPLYVLAIIVVVLTGRSATNIILIIAILNTPIFLRLTRSEVLSLRSRTFVETARANGEGELSIALRQVFPNAVGPAFAQAPITLGLSILITAGLSFIGAGIQPPTPEWGAMIAAGAGGLVIGEWWVSVFPGIFMSLTVFSFAVLGESLHNVVLRRM
jgi:peptide/nickel transport system permease protein